jgi:hypothetical protein
MNIAGILRYPAAYLTLRVLRQSFHFLLGRKSLDKRAGLQ